MMKQYLLDSLAQARLLPVVNGRSGCSAASQLSKQLQCYVQKAQRCYLYLPPVQLMHLGD